MRHLLVTNDFPPKVGGIQSYLWELWRRLPPGDVTVLTSPHPDAGAWDAAQAFRVERVREPVLIPHPGLVARIRSLAAEVGAEAIVIDPVLPLGLVGPSVSQRGSIPVGMVLHGAEIAVPGRLPLSRQLLGHTLRSARFVIAAGGYPLAEAERAAGRHLAATVVPPGVDTDRFRPLDQAARRDARIRLGLPPQADLVVSVSRLVPRKGMDTLIRAVARLASSRPGLCLAISGDGREMGRLRRLAVDTGAPVRFLGRVPEADLPDVYACGDVFAMLCHDRWGGLEQEGFGIVFLEAAAAGVAQVAGRSGGSHEAVEHGVTGLVVDEPTDVDAVTRSLAELLDDPGRRCSMAVAGRRRAVEEFSYDVLAAQLATSMRELALGATA